LSRFLAVWQPSLAFKRKPIAETFDDRDVALKLMKTNNAVVNYILDEMAASSCCEPPSVWFIFVVRPAFLCADVSFSLTVHL